jgi:thioesterase domain-containing protein/acyl carrier protein
MRLILTNSSYWELAEQLRDTVNKNIGIIKLAEPTAEETTGENRSAPPLDHLVTGIYDALSRGETISFKQKPIDQNIDYSLSQLRDYLSRHLPNYMLPSYFVQIEKIPMTPNGKIDRKALPEPEAEAAPDVEKYKPPRNETEEQLVRIWAEILKIQPEKISINSNFFELGGTSLTLIELISRIYKEFSLAVPLNQIFTRPTIMEISSSISSTQYIEESMVLLNQKVEKNIFCFPGGAGFAISYSNLANLFENHSFYSFNFLEDNENIIDEYANIITKTQPQGPYKLFGYCAGGILAFQVAKVLENRGCEVSDIIMADSFWNKNGTQEYGEDEREFVQQVEEEVERMGLGFLKEKVKQKTENYQKYILDLKILDVIQAKIHYIMSEELKNADIDVKAQWSQFITKPMTIYEGHGRHQAMLMPGTGAMENNADIIKNILNKKD